MRRKPKEEPLQIAVTQPVCSEHFTERLYQMADKATGEQSDALRKAGDLIGSIDRECSLCKPHQTLPDRVQSLILKADNI